MEQLAYRPRDAARMLGISISSFWNLVAQGKIKTRKLSSRTTIIEAKELERFIREAGMEDK